MCTSTGEQKTLTAEERKLVEENQRLVWHIVLTMVNRGCLREGLVKDAVQEGMMGLMNAARLYDPGRGTAFTTLAWKCIRQKVSELARKERKREKRIALSLDEAIEDASGKAEPRLWAESIPAKDDTEAEALESMPDVCLRLLKEKGRGDLAEVLRMYVLEDETMLEIAQELGITKQCVQQRLRKAGLVIKRKMPNAEWK